METKQSTVYWKPNESITVKGTELAALLQVVDLQTMALNQIPLNTLMDVFALASQAKNDIIQRLSDEGKLSATPTEEVSEENTAENTAENTEEIYEEISDVQILQDNDLTTELL